MMHTPNCKRSATSLSEILQQGECYLEGSRTFRFTKDQQEQYDMLKVAKDQQEQYADASTSKVFL